MAIFSLNHSWLGKSHKDYSKGIASTHANYITRESACTTLIGERCPTEREALRRWIFGQEMHDRKNARIIDKVMVALPIEMTRAQREALVREFCEHITEGRASWAAAIHENAQDADNPHAHIILRDRDFETGRRVMETTERGSTEWLREQWELITNRALAREGIDARIDRRTLAEQGIDRKSERHYGPHGQPRDRSEEHFSAEREAEARFEPRDEPKRQRGGEGSGLDWSDHAGMVEQQRSAMEWVREAGERRRADSERDAPHSKYAPLSEFAERLAETTDRRQREESREREATDEHQRKAGVDAVIAKRRADRERENEGGHEL